MCSRIYRASRTSGFTLVEAMVALVLIGIVLVLGLMTMSRVRLYDEIMATKRAAYSLAADVLEEIASGELLVELGESEVAPENLPRNSLPPASTRVELEVESSAEGTDLYDVRVAVYYDSSGRPKEARLATRFWRPR